MEISDWISLFVALATLYLGWTTWRMAKVTQKALDEHSKPYVIVYAKQSEDRPTVIEIVIENVGFAPAYGVSFEISDNFLHRCWGFDEKTNEDGKKFTSGPFINGIPMLVPNQKFTIDWGQFGGIKQSLGGKSATIIAKYKNDIGKELPPITSVLDINEFETNTAYTPAVVRQAVASEKIEKNLTSIQQVIDRKLKPQSSMEAYKWAYTAYLLLEYPREWLYPLHRGVGLTSAQIEQAENEARAIIQEYRPDLIEEE